ncbi:nephrin-like [Patiria miniata]|uniref:Uncharacterized protein n=1 Tax=Patiria miniata TaxID=46514 RepID=A0A914AMI9_PATMI|nr:nephrin-like [Patiria miniata]
MSQSDIQPQPVGGNQEILQAIQALTNAIDSKVQSACKKQKLTDTPTFKRDGNQQQFSHCEKVLNLIKTSLQNIETLDLDEAKSNLKEAIKATKERQKLIRLADRSELGWGVVKEYVADTLAEDSSDEKRIKKVSKGRIHHDQVQGFMDKVGDLGFIKTRDYQVPGQPIPICTLHTSHLSSTGSKSTAELAAAAVKWVHSLAGLPSPTDNSIVKMALQGFKRQNSSPTIRKDPITPDILTKLHTFFPPTVHAQTVTVTLLPVSTVQGQSATLTCTFSLDGPGAFNNVEWRQRGTLIADFYNGAQTPTYGTGFSEPDYVASRNDSMSTLTIASTHLSVDDGGYSCMVSYKDGFTNYHGAATSHLIVYVFPSSITLSDLTGSYPSTGGTSYLIEGMARQFTCEVPGINPGASFTWSLDGGVITPDNTVNVTGADKLTTSTSLATVSPAWNSHGEMLQCQASNKDGHDGISISVTLDIKVPPKTSSMSMYDSNGAFAPGGSVSVDQDASHTFTCQTQSRPAATIQWDVGSPSYQESIIGPTNPGPGNGLVDTTRTWTFTSNRTNHRQDVKCTANTSESQQPYPTVMVTLNVNGPPDMPVISGNAGSTSMTENDSIVLTCTADMGYPDDWTLVWSNGGSPGPTTSSSASGDRYSFTSTLDYTPRRQDNGNTITCTANRAPWIPGPVGSLGPIDVKFCASSLTVTGSDATAGSTVTLRCETTESSNPATTLTWYKGSVQLTTPTDQPNTPGDNGGRVTTVNYTTDVLDRTNNGDVYKCCATNPTISSCVTLLCNTHTLNVGYPPDFTSLTQTPQTPVTEGIDVTLTCTVDANPSTVDITWKRNDPGDAFNPTNGLTSTLTLSNIRREQAGYYTCTANNGVPTDNPADVVSSSVTVIVHYEVNVTNKAMNKVGVKNGDTAVLTCIVVGNPKPVMEWYWPNNTEIFSDTDGGKFLITNETSGGDGVFELEVTSKLTVKTVDSQVDYGIYICISSNGIGKEDSLNITLTGTRRPDKPTRVEITERTAESLTVTWTPGYDGGETQSFRVSCIKTSDSTDVFTEDTDWKTTSTATGLDDYTEYEIRVYAKNSIGESIGYGNATGYTLR